MLFIVSKCDRFIVCCDERAKKWLDLIELYVKRDTVCTFFLTHIMMIYVFAWLTEKKASTRKKKAQTKIKES